MSATSAVGATASLRAPERVPLDLRLIPAAATAWGAAGWACASDPGPVLVAATVALAATVVLVLAATRRRESTRQRWRPTAALALGAAGLVLLSTAGHLAVRGAGVLPDLVEQAAVVTVTGRVTAEPRPVRPDPSSWRADDDAERFVVRVQVDEITGRGVRGPARARVLLLGGADVGALGTGDTVRVAGRLAAAEPGDDVVALLLPTGPVDADPPDGADGVAAHLRDGLRQATDPLPADSRGLLPGLVVGDTSRLPADLEDAMRTTGLTHLTAVSGHTAHV
ncbi:ComEC/Rec2 family competence protein [Thalassiella azotivora]